MEEPRTPARAERRRTGGRRTYLRPRQMHCVRCRNLGVSPDAFLLCPPLCCRLATKMSFRTPRAPSRPLPPLSKDPFAKTKLKKMNRKLINHNIEARPSRGSRGERLSSLDRPTGDIECIELRAQCGKAWQADVRVCADMLCRSFPSLAVGPKEE